MLLLSARKREGGGWGGQGRVEAGEGKGGWREKICS